MPLNARQKAVWLCGVPSASHNPIFTKKRWRNVQRLRGGLVFKVCRLVYHSTLGLRVIKKKKKKDTLNCVRESVGHTRFCTSDAPVQSMCTPGLNTVLLCGSLSVIHTRICTTPCWARSDFYRSVLDTPGFVPQRVGNTRFFTTTRWAHSGLHQGHTRAVAAHTRSEQGSALWDTVRYPPPDFFLRILKYTR